MPLKNALIAEMKHESGLTKKILEKVPMDKKDWKPHEKSMTLGRLATHIAQNLHWTSEIIQGDEFDFMKRTPPGGIAASTEELLKILQTNFDQAISDLDTMSDDDLAKHWVARAGEKIMYDIPKKVAIRNLVISHMIHHRGQLSVYLRLLDVPVPSIYGPSADER